MRLGISSYTYPWAIGIPGQHPHDPMSAQRLLGRASELGVHVVQVADNLPLDQLESPEIDALGKTAANENIDIEVGTRGIGIQQLTTYLKLAQRLGSPIVRVVIDTRNHHPSVEEVVKTLLEVVPEFENAGVHLAIENHDRFGARTLVDIIKRVGNDCVGICLDTVNSFGALEGPEVVLRALGPLVVNLHVKDFSIFRADHMMGFTIEGRPAGKGQLNIPWLLQELRGLGTDPNAILELWTPPSDTIASTVAKEDAWAIESVAYLRTLIPD